MTHKLIGDKAFYKHVLAIAVPIMIQNGITNFVNMLDNIMVGSTGTAQMTGVTIANHLIFVFNLCIFGAASGAGIFGAQFYGKKDNEGLRYTLRFKIYITLLFTVIGCLLFVTLGDRMILSFLKGEGSKDNAINAFKAAKEYLLIMLIGFFPFAIAQSYSSSLRETNETVLPMKASFAAVIVNLIFNYILIFEHFGSFGFKAKGAAVATVISRFTEMFIVVLWVHKHKEKCPYAEGLFKNFKIPKNIFFGLIGKTVPLALNETIWSSGVAMVNHFYSLRSLEIVAATSISSTFWNVFSVAFIAVGIAIGIIIGNMLGADRLSEVKETDNKLIAFSVFCGFSMGLIFASLSPFIPYLYKTEPEIRILATKIIIISACIMPFNALSHSCYFTLRSGGKAFITFIFDSGFQWLGSVLTAFMLVKFTTLPILPIYIICQSIDALKSFMGLYLVRKGKWIRNIVNT